MGMTSSPTLYRREHYWSLSHGRLDQVRGRWWARVALFQTLLQGIERIDSRSPHGLPSVDLNLPRFDHRRPALNVGLEQSGELHRRQLVDVERQVITGVQRFISASTCALNSAGEVPSGSM